MLSTTKASNDSEVLQSLLHGLLPQPYCTSIITDEVGDFYLYSTSLQSLDESFTFVKQAAYIPIWGFTPIFDNKKIR